MEGGRLVAPFDPTAAVSPYVERPAKGILNASDLLEGFTALAGGGAGVSRGLSEDAMLKRIRLFYPDATREEAAFLMPTDGSPFTLEYARILLSEKLGPSFDPVAEAMRAFTPHVPLSLSATTSAAIAHNTTHTHTHAHATHTISHHNNRQPAELSLVALRRISASLRSEKNRMSGSSSEYDSDNKEVSGGLSSAEIDQTLMTMWDIDGDGRIGLEDVRAALGRERAARTAP